MILVKQSRSTHHHLSTYLLCYLCTGQDAQKLLAWDLEISEGWKQVLFTQIHKTHMYVQTSNRRPYLYLFTCAFYNAPSTTSSLFPILKHCTIQENYSRKQLHFQLTLNSMTLAFWEFIKSSRKQTALHLSKDRDGQHSTRGCVHMDTDTNCE